MNNSYYKVLKYYAFVGVRFEYSHHFEKYEQVYRNVCNMNSLSKQFKKKINTTEG